jgi:hypothetical protein
MSTLGVVTIEDTKQVSYEGSDAGGGWTIDSGGGGYDGSPWTPGPDNSGYMDTATYAANESTQIANQAEQVLITEVNPTFAKSEADAAVEAAFKKNNVVITAISDVAVAKTLALTLGHLGLLGAIVKALADATGLTQSAKSTLSNFANNPTSSISAYSTNTQAATEALAEAKNKAAAADVIAGNNEASNTVNEALNANSIAANEIEKLFLNQNFFNQSSVQIAVLKIQTTIDATSTAKNKITNIQNRVTKAAATLPATGVTTMIDTQAAQEQAALEFAKAEIAAGRTVQQITDDVNAYFNKKFTTQNISDYLAANNLTIQAAQTATGLSKNTLLILGGGLVLLFLLRK